MEFLRHPFLLTAATCAGAGVAVGKLTTRHRWLGLIACLVGIVAAYEGLGELVTVRRAEWIVLRTRRRRRLPASGVPLVRTLLWAIGACWLVLLGQKKYLYETEGPKASVESLVQWANGALVVRRGIASDSGGVVWVRQTAELDHVCGFALATAVATAGAPRSVCLLTRRRCPWPLFVRTVRVAGDPAPQIQQLRRIVREDPQVLIIADGTVSDDSATSLLLLMLAAETALPFYMQTVAGGRADTRDGCAVPFVMVGVERFAPAQTMEPRPASVSWDDYVASASDTAQRLLQELRVDATTLTVNLRGEALNFPPGSADERASTGLPLELADSIVDVV